MAVRDALQAKAAKLSLPLQDGQPGTDGALPGPGFWNLPDAELQQAAPWNGGAFRTARDALFTAAVRLHRAFIVAARTLKPSLNTIARAVRGGPGAPVPSTASDACSATSVPARSAGCRSTRPGKPRRRPPSAPSGGRVAPW